MSDTIKGAIISALITASVSVIIFLAGNFSTQATLEKKTVETLSDYFNSVDKEMSYQKALQTIYEESVQKDTKIAVLEQQNAEYDNALVNTPNLEYKNPAIIVDGLKVQDSANKAVLMVENKSYFSENVFNSILNGGFSYDSSRNTISYNTNGGHSTTETKIELLDTEVLYDGFHYKKFLPSDGSTFSMGSNTYNKGFEIWDEQPLLWGNGDGYALFDLQGNYSKMTFSVGRTNEKPIQDVVLKVYLNQEYVEEYSLSGQSPPVQIEIDLHYANDMKLEITGGTSVTYGFANVILYY